MSAPGSLMQGKKGLIMGVANDRSIAWGIARMAAQHGAELAFTFQGEALERRVRPLAASVNSPLVLPCDVTDDASLDATFAAIEKQCNDLSAWVETTADSICRSSVGFAVLTADPRVLALYGMTTHAVQDFYSHTNWVELLSPFLAGKSPGAFPVWEEIMDENSAWLRLHPDFPREQVLARMKLSDQFTSKNAREGGLQSGKARGAPEWDGDPPWEHRHAEGAVHEVIEVLSRRASTLWIRRIESLLDKH